MPIKTWLIWWITGTIMFLFDGNGVVVSILFGLMFVVLTELLHHIFNKIGGW